MATLKELHQAYTSHGLASLDAKTATPAQMAEWAKTTGAYFGAAKDVAQWASSSGAAEELVPLAGLSGQPVWKAGKLTTHFRSWAKGRSLDDLRGAAKALGMDPQGASRA